MWVNEEREKARSVKSISATDLSALTHLDLWTVYRGRIRGKGRKGGRREGREYIRGVFSVPYVSRTSHPPIYSPSRLFSLQPEENSSMPCIPLTFLLWVYLLHLSFCTNIILSSSPLIHGCLFPPLSISFSRFLLGCLFLSLSFIRSVLPLSLPACSSRPVKAGGSPEPSTPSRSPPAQPGWLAGSLAHFQHTHKHTHRHTHTQLFFCLSLLTVLYLLVSLSF